MELLCTELHGLHWSRPHSHPKTQTAPKPACALHWEFPDPENLKQKLPKPFLAKDPIV